MREQETKLGKFGWRRDSSPDEIENRGIALAEKEKGGTITPQEQAELDAIQEFLDSAVDDVSIKDRGAPIEGPPDFQLGAG